MGYVAKCDIFLKYHITVRFLDLIIIHHNERGSRMRNGRQCEVAKMRYFH